MEVVRITTALKALVRTGWMQRGIPPSMGETVAAHLFESAVLAYYLASRLASKGRKVDPNRAAVLALFHDAGEAILGDLPKWATDNLGENKRNAELEANRELGTDGLFMEYKAQNTVEAKVARLSDRLSTVLQGLRYERMGFDVREIIHGYMREIEVLLNELPELRDDVDRLMKSL